MSLPKITISGVGIAVRVAAGIVRMVIRRSQKDKSINSSSLSFHS